MDHKIETIAGLEWRFEKISAISAKAKLDEPEPNLRRYISVCYNGQWIPLDNNDVIRKYVPDWETLLELENRISEYNYGFLRDWQPRKIPDKMVANYRQVDCKHMDGLFMSIITNNLATLHELKTMYSLEDAFLLLEVNTVSKINEFNANEAAK